MPSNVSLRNNLKDFSSAIMPFRFEFVTFFYLSILVFDDVQTSFSLSDVDFGKSFVVRDFHLTLCSVLICLHLK